MAKLVVSLFTIPISTLITIWVMIKGWGLTAQNWQVIIWGAVLQLVVLFLMQAATSDKK